MIAKLTGTVDSIGGDFAVIDVGGVGYRVQCSGRTLRDLPPAGGKARLLIETVVRDDRIDLYGFTGAIERDWYRLLVSVQGVGAKLALSLLGTLSVGELGRAVASEDKATLSRADGVGPKLAGRIANELKDKAKALGIEPVAAATGAPSLDAVSALVNLGYRRTEAHEAVLGAAGRLGPEASLETLIRAGLRELGG